MIELTWVGDALRWAGGLYWLLAIGALVLATAKIKPIAGKIISVTAIIALFGYLPITAALENKKASDASKAAWAHFETRCKGAGEKIYRMAENVEGIMLLKVRPDSDYNDWRDPLWPGAAFAKEREGNDYIKSFMMYENRDPKIPDKRGYVSNILSPRPGYRYVDVVDNSDGIRYRYTLPFKLRPSSKNWGDYEFHRTPTNAPPPRYGVTFKDIVDPEDRKFWVAGSIVKIIDLETNEVMGELIRYAVDIGLGNANQRSPWLLSHVCPRTDGLSGAKTRFFVDQILKPIKDNE